jgi:hypothetical protein
MAWYCTMLSVLTKNTTLICNPVQLVNLISVLEHVSLPSELGSTYITLQAGRCRAFMSNRERGNQLLGAIKPFTNHSSDVLEAMTMLRENKICNLSGIALLAHTLSFESSIICQNGTYINWSLVILKLSRSAWILVTWRRHGLILIPGILFSTTYVVIYR